jgi:glutathione S-transferase
MSELTLVLGNKAYSSWSLRPWLALRKTGAPFREVVIPLNRPETKASIRAYSAAGKVPVLRDGALTVWDSLAICEYLAERFPAARLWPEAPVVRALARSVAAEMHAGFVDLRRSMPMDLKRVPALREPTPEAAVDIARITGLWRELRASHGAGGPFLFGGFSIADAMYAPVCTRLRAYGVALDAVSAAYVEAVYADPDMAAWVEAGRAEPWVIAY